MSQSWHTPPTGAQPWHDHTGAQRAADAEAADLAADNALLGEVAFSADDTAEAWRTEPYRQPLTEGGLTAPSKEAARVQRALDRLATADEEQPAPRRVGVKGSTNGKRDTARGESQPDAHGRAFFGL